MAWEKIGRQAHMTKMQRMLFINLLLMMLGFYAATLVNYVFG